MLTKKKVILAAAAILGGALAASAKDQGPPRIDIEKTCQANSSALASSMGGEMKANFDSCVADEKMALEQIARDLAKYPASARAQCLQSDQYLPSYVEWLVCLDMTRDVMKKRQDASDSSSSTTIGSSAKDQASNRRTRPGRKECPIVKANQDGSIAWVDACPLGPPY